MYYHLLQQFMFIRKLKKMFNLKFNIFKQTHY